MRIGSYRKRRATDDAIEYRKVKAEKGRDELREGLDILEGQLGTGMRPTDLDDRAL